ncbi:MAG: hypothetical protein U5R31_13630 [Acidimicrobiia bacterium]|nr:hypothetical protein [Acidimicrobiia bacterium]
MVVWAVFRSPALDYRLVMLGAVLPIGEVVIGGTWVLHTLVGAVVVLFALVLATSRRRLLRRRLIGLPIGILLHLVLDLTWTRAELFWWPFAGGDALGGQLPALGRPVALLLLMDLAGAVALVWAYRRFGLDDPLVAPGSCGPASSIARSWDDRAGRRAARPHRGQRRRTAPRPAGPAPGREPVEPRRPPWPRPSAGSTGWCRVRCVVPPRPPRRSARPSGSTSAGSSSTTATSTAGRCGSSTPPCGQPGVGTRATPPAAASRSWTSRIASPVPASPWRRRATAARSSW